MWVGVVCVAWGVRGCTTSIIVCGVYVGVCVCLFVCGVRVWCARAGSMNSSKKGVGSYKRQVRRNFHIEKQINL